MGVASLLIICCQARSSTARGPIAESAGGSGASKSSMLGRRLSGKDELAQAAFHRVCRHLATPFRFRLGGDEFLAPMIIVFGPRPKRFR